MSTLPAKRSSKAANSPISNKSLRMKASESNCSGRSRDPCWPWMAMPSVLALRTFSLCSALFGWKWTEDQILILEEASRHTVIQHQSVCTKQVVTNDLRLDGISPGFYRGRENLVCVSSAASRGGGRFQAVSSTPPRPRSPTTPSAAPTDWLLAGWMRFCQ